MFFFSQFCVVFTVIYKRFCFQKQNYLMVLTLLCLGLAGFSSCSLDLNTSCWNVELQVTVGPSAMLRKSIELNNNLGLDPLP